MKDDLQKILEQNIISDMRKSKQKKELLENVIKQSETAKLRYESIIEKEIEQQELKKII